MSEVEKVEKLMEQGFGFLGNFEFDKAIKLGKQLKKLRHSSAFEIMALAYKGKGNLQKAVRILEEGVKLAPKVWRLWQLLGNYYSDNSSWTEAQKCYISALTCPNVEKSSVYYNSAIAFVREDKYADALKQYEKITDKNFYLKASSLKVEILTGLGRYDEAMRSADDILKKDRDNEDVEDLAYMYAALSETMWKQNNYEEALNLAWEAITLYKQQTKAQWLIREIEGKTSYQTKYFRLLVEGIWPEPFEAETETPGFFTTYYVVAETPEEAMGLLKRFEPVGVRETLIISEYEILEKRSQDPKGVYFTSGYAFFPREK